ncbi:hypothetical protein JCM6882_000458 [Rhodosporidiobolus microsporus]
MSTTRATTQTTHAYPPAPTGAHLPSSSSASNSTIAASGVLPSSQLASSFSTLQSAASNVAGAGTAAEEEAGEGDGREVAALEPVDRGRGAWGFVLAAFLLETFIWGFSYSFATILVYLETHDPWQKASIASLSAIGTTQLGLQFILPTVVVLFFRRYPEWVKTTVYVSAAISCASMFLSSWATEVWHLILAQGIVCGTANAVLFSPVWSWFGEWWSARRGLAFGIVLSGIGVGGFGFPFLIDGLLARGGFPWLCRAWAFITALVFGLSAWIIRPRIPVVKPKSAAERGPWLAVDWRFAKDPIFLLMGFSSLLAALSYLPVALYLPQYAASLTPSTTQQNLVLAIFNLSAAIGSAASGPISDWSYPVTVVGCAACGTVISLAAWGTADSLGKVYGFAVLFAATGQMVSAWGGAAKDVSGSNPNTSTLVFCLFSVVRGIASIVMPFVSETLYEQDKRGEGAAWGAFGFEKMIIFVGITAFLSLLGGVALHFVRQQRRKATVALR